MRVAIKMQNNVVVLVREWDDAVPITDINASEIDGPWIELTQPVTVDVGYAYDRERDVFAPPDPEAAP